MKKNILTAAVVFVSFSYTSIFAQDTWIKQKLDEKIYVKFPKAPEALGNNKYKVQSVDNNTYTAELHDLGDYVDSATFADMDTVKFANGYIERFALEFEGLKIKNLQ